MFTYLEFLRTILKQGIHKPDRTGVGIQSLFGYQMRFDLTQGFPLVTTKKIILNSVIHELLWFLKGETCTQYLKENGVSIWDAWANERGELGPVYGKQWRAWESSDGQCIDQIQTVIDTIKRDPYSRRLIVSAWNVGELEQMALPPCHLLCQFYVHDKHLSCQLYQRSADAFLGVPFNISSYALLTHMIAQQTGLIPYEFVWTGGDCHIYDNHVSQVKEQLNRQPYPLPQLRINRCPLSINDYQFKDFDILNYQHHSRIIAPIAV